MQALRKIEPILGARLEACSFMDKALPGEVIVRVSAAGICGSDVHAYNWDSGYGFMEPYLPLTLGHEFAGVIIKTGADVTGIKEGDRVVCWPTITCGACVQCQAGRPIYCVNRCIIGLHRDGGFASFVRMPPANALRLPDGLPLEIAALAEPLSVAINAVDVSELAENDRVIVLGPGMIGLGIALIAQARGAQVMLAGYGDTHRLALAQQMGVSSCIDIQTQDLADAVADFGLPDIIFEATGQASSIESGLALLRPGGVLAVVGIHGKPATIDLNQLVRGKKQLRGCHDTTPRAFAEAISRLAEAPALYGQLITHRMPIEDFATGFERANAREALKVMLYPNGNFDV